jgi:hypothetical protein
MRTPPGLPARIRTDASNAFAHHTLLVRVPAILDTLLQQNADYAPEIQARVRALALAITRDERLPAPARDAPQAESWGREHACRAQESWLGTDWFFAENYLYRCLVDAIDYWRSKRDPFLVTKREEYGSDAHRTALEAAVSLSGSPPLALERLLLASLFGNRIDLSFAASRAHGTLVGDADLLIDERAPALECLLGGNGAVHLILDNAGTELSVDLVFACRVLEWLKAPVVLHVKMHPCFVSDTIDADVRWFVEARHPEAVALWCRLSAAARGCRTELARALGDGRLRIAPHPFWNGPLWLWELPADLERDVSGARLVLLKGDANYRRALGDALWAPESSFAVITRYFPAPLLALRTLKSDPIVGLAPGVAAQLDREDARWRVNGQRGVASFGGCSSPRGA